MSASRGSGAPRPLPTRLARLGRPCAILVAEDDRARGELLQEALAGAGHRAAVARGLAEVEGTLAGGAPVVVATAQHSRYFADWHARGFAALLVKPLNLNDLLATIDGQPAPGR